MDGGTRSFPVLVTNSDGASLVECPCGRVNAVRAGVAYQCGCGWAVLLAHSAGTARLESAFRRDAQ